MAPRIGASTRSTQMCLLREKNYCCASRVHPLSRKCFRVCSPFSLWLSPLCFSGCKVALSVLLNRSLIHLRVYLQLFHIYFQISFIFSSELCIFFPCNVCLLWVWGFFTVSSRLVEQCWVLPLCLSPAFTLSPVDCEFSEYTSWLFNSHLSLHLRSLEEVCVSKPGSKWRWQGNFLPPQQQKLRKKVALFVCPFSTARYLGISKLLELKICNIDLCNLISCHFL